MIVPLAERVRSQLGSVTQMERAQADLASVQASLTKIREVSEISKGVTQAAVVVRDRLPAERRAKVAALAAAPLGDLRASRAAFTTQHRQDKSLTTVMTGLVRLGQEIAEGWHDYARAEFTPQRELLSLVEQLPEFRGQALTLQSLLRRIEGQVAAPPSSAEQLAAFDHDLQTLAGELMRIDGLGPQVRIFLRRVLDRTATLEDLDDEVLAWCRQAGRGRGFLIRFRDGGP